LRRRPDTIDNGRQSLATGGEAQLATGKFGIILAHNEVSRRPDRAKRTILEALLPGFAPITLVPVWVLSQHGG
jgi:hypothetical protein